MMDMRGHHIEAADMTSLAVASSSPNFMQSMNIGTSGSSVGALYGNTGLPSTTKVKTLTLNTSVPSTAGEELGNIELAPTLPGGGVEAGNSNNRLSDGNTKLAPPAPVDDIRVPTSLELKKASKKPVKYRECLKNHAANLGGYANDGCGEFMPSGEEGTLEALKCAACNCHRNFHRREVEGEEYAGNCECRYGPNDRKRIIEPLFPSPLPLPPPSGLHLHVRPPPQMVMAFNPHDSDEYDGGLLSPQSHLKKRFRTKFTTEQKEQMNMFAEKLGWRIQKHDEAAVQEFCMEIGVKRHVLKVWMHNNKHSLGKKLLTQGCEIGTNEDEIRS